MLNLDSLKKQNKKFKITLLFSYILFATLILAAIYLLHVKYSANESIKNLQDELEKEAGYKQTFFSNLFQKNVDVVKAISHNEIFIDFIKNGKKDYKHVDSLFETIMLSNSNYMQLRYIDKNGQEIIRIDRKDIHTKPTLIAKENLQNKAQRYYFEKSMNIKQDEIWFSKIDLNIEHEKIEEPIKPVLRVAHQVHVGSSLEGIVIINIFMKEYLQSLSESSTYDVYMVDKDGYFIIDKDGKHNWSRYLEKKTHLSEVLDIEQTLLGDKIYFNADKRFLIQPLSYEDYNDYKLIYFENSKKVQKAKDLIKERALITVLFALLIAIPFAYISSSPAKIIYQNLYEKSNEITELANNLEIKVKEEIEKNLGKDRLLENQSKLAALGEMLGNIAHQWRHPLTRVSLILQNIKTFKTLGKLSDEQLDKYISNALEQITYMSETIDDFKDFYKPDNQSTIFKASEVVMSANKIIGASIKHQGIQIIMDNEHDFLIQGFKNQFAQVILNIMHNAKEAIEVNFTKSSFIKIKLIQDNHANLITVEDNAGGIDPHKIGKIFDAYFTTKKDNGTGIGLYMSKMIINENFHAKLYVKNTPVGALFTIELPKL